MDAIGDCASLGEIREQIDRLDESIVVLLAQRSRYVVQAARFKATAADVRAPVRAAAVVANAGKIASREGADAATIERIYREIVASFTDLELAKHAE